MEATTKKSFFENGNLKYKVTYNFEKEISKFRFFYKNGQLRWKGMLKNGKEEGEWTYYFEDGKLFCIEYWKDGIKTDCIAH
jgi:antitoxin component YwqK of YwqJK toxin-antitoxin module